jgi:hypothetical protein
MSEFERYRKKGFAEMRPYREGEDLTGVSVSDADRANGSPALGDMIARNPSNHDDKWLVAALFFVSNYERVDL